MSGQDQPNRTLWLATRVGKMAPSCPLGTTRCIPQERFPRKPYNKSFIDQVCSVKVAGYWQPSFLRVYGPRLNTRTQELGQYPAILTSHLVNNPYKYFFLTWKQLQVNARSKWIIRIYLQEFTKMNEKFQYCTRRTCAVLKILSSLLVNKCR